MNRKRKKWVLLSGIWLLAAGALLGCQTAAEENETALLSEEATETETQGDTESYTKDIFAMDTYMTVTAYGENAKQGVEAGIAEIQRLDELLSIGIETSDIAKINTNNGGSVGTDSEYLIKTALEMYQDTGGTFDIAVYPLMQEWGFTSGNYQVPSDARIKELLALSNASKIKLDETAHTVSFETEGMGIDLGAIAKGYTSQRVMEVFAENGVKSGVVSLGGNVQVLGSKPDASDWRVAIENPEDTSDYIGILSTSDKAVITSGGYERYFEQDGVKYHHILDPSTGYPSDSGLISVTIVNDDGTYGDILSTALFVMGEEKAIAYWREHADSFDFIIETGEQKLLVSEGIGEQFQTDYDMTIVKREQ